MKCHCREKGRGYPDAPETQMRLTPRNKSSYLNWMLSRCFTYNHLVTHLFSELLSFPTCKADEPGHTFLCWDVVSLSFPSIVPWWSQSLVSRLVAYGLPWALRITWAICFRPAGYCSIPAPRCASRYPCAPPPTPTHSCTSGDPCLVLLTACIAPMGHCLHPIMCLYLPISFHFTMCLYLPISLLYQHHNTFLAQS